MIRDQKWRSDRARKAGRAAAKARRVMAAKAAERFTDKPQAWSAGYRTGYSAAMRWWKWAVAKAMATQ